MRDHKIQIVIKNGKINARVTWNENGKRKALWRSGSTKTEARDRLRQALRERESLTTSGKFGPHAKFSVIMQWYLDRYVVAPVYVGDRKVSGLRSGDSVRGYARALLEYFGARSLNAITYSDLESYKSFRLRGITKRGKGRSIASVNRELALARRVFNIAEREGWLARSPFRRGEPLISSADERKGWRVMSFDEEDRLLAVCKGRLEHLKAVLICAVDTGMRAGEIFSLRWSDVKQGYIRIAALNTKTMHTRYVPISDRLQSEFDHLWERSVKDRTERVFQLTTVKRSFRSACRLADIEHGEPNGLSLRCLRRTAGTRWTQAGVSREEVSKILGHSNPETTYRHYITADLRTIQHLKEVTDRINQTSRSQPEMRQAAGD